jgi:hypothetical protein
LESECPRYDELVAQLNSSPDVRKRLDSNKEMLDYLAVKSGLNMTEIDDFEYLYDTLFIEVSKFHFKIKSLINNDLIRNEFFCRIVSTRRCPNGLKSTFPGL